MHVDIIPNRKSKPCVLLRETVRENGQVKHRTVLNLSDLAPDRIMAIKRAFQGEFDEVAFSGLEGCKSEQGPQFGALYALHQLAKEVGLVSALGRDRTGRLALLMVLGQVIGGKSRRALVQWAVNQAVLEVLGLGDRNSIGFDEEDLYEVLTALSDRRFDIEMKLFKKRNKRCSRMFLYDVTSCYLEGQCNELSDWGYNRDGKSGKKQIVIGLLTDKDGDPVAVDVFRGNTSDPKTVLDQIKLLSHRFGVKDVVFVGDRGMLKSMPLESLNQADFSYITAITKPQIERLMKEGVLQLGMFDDTLAEIEYNGIRYIFRRNPIRAAQIEQSRQERLRKAQTLACSLSERLAVSQRRQLAVGVKSVQQKLKGLKIDDVAKVVVNGRRISVEVDPEAYRLKSRLDGVYVLKTDTSGTDLDKEAVHKAYKGLSEVERDFRTMKTDLDVRPVYVRKQSRTRGHVLVVMLALILRRESEKRLANIDLVPTRAVEILNGWTVLRESLGSVRYSRLPAPNAHQQEILDALEVKQPTSLCVYSNKKKRNKK